MRYYRISFLFLVVCAASSSLSNSLVQAQTRNGALSQYNSGSRKLLKGDLDGAIHDLTNSIDISSRPWSAKSTHQTDSAEVNSFADDTNGITIVDPLTAVAYTNRGLARYRKGDVEGALADWDLAIRINPRSAEAYLNRGAGKLSLEILTAR